MVLHRFLLSLYCVVIYYLHDSVNHDHENTLKDFLKVNLNHLKLAPACNNNALVIDFQDNLYTILNRMKILLLFVIRCPFENVMPTMPTLKGSNVPACFDKLIASD